MPPFVPRKRSQSPVRDHRDSKRAKRDTPASKTDPAKPTKSTSKAKSRSSVFDAVDAAHESSKNGGVGEKATLESNQKWLNALGGDDSDSDDEDEDMEFEDVEIGSEKANGTRNQQSSEEDDEDEDDEGMWEDALNNSVNDTTQEIADVSISLNEDGQYVPPVDGPSATTGPGVSGKKGPSKRERQARIQTHCLHVQSLMWHNLVRNSWCNDKEVQKTLVEGLSEGVKKEVKRWRLAMGYEKRPPPPPPSKKVTKSKSGGRDWGDGGRSGAPGSVNLSGGDPLLRLLRVLAAYWRKRFAATAPGLRKKGYMPLRRLREEMKAWGKNNKDIERHGERIENRAAFRELAQKCEGSRDVGAMLFVALMRGLGIETRMVVNLQPAGLGWSKAEEADEKGGVSIAEDAAETDDDDVQFIKGGPKETMLTMNGKDSQEKTKPKPKSAVNKGQPERLERTPTRRSVRGNQGDPINLAESDTDSDLSSARSNVSAAPPASDDDLSIVDITPSAVRRRKITKKYDRDLPFPNYWTEVCSPVSHKWFPVDPVVLSTIASTDELLASFEPRGKRADISKQVMAYTVAFAADGTAKDVTVRYLKKHQLPGKTKGMRMSVERIPVYNRKGKILRYEQQDWFRQLMSLFDRPENKLTAADKLEDGSDLKPFKAGASEKEVQAESLAGYRQSAEYVLEAHLRREEALLATAEPVRVFVQGKGDKAKEHPVYLRKDVVACKTVESWHKEGRAIREGEHPRKLVPMRAVTLIRKREMEDSLRETGEKLKQGLYSKDQTDWIIPPPIKDGIIPKNAYGNMDVYVPTMVPEGAVHLPLKGSAKLCKRLDIDYAEACTGFEFGHQRAVPVLTGVVVAEEHEMLVRDAWRDEQKEAQRKADVKRQGLVLGWWRKMVLGLRVLDRMQREYEVLGEGGEEERNPFIARANGRARVGAEESGTKTEGETGGGFLLPEDSYGGERGDGSLAERAEAAEDDGGFLAEDGEEGEGGFLAEEEAKPTSRPMSLMQSTVVFADGNSHSEGESAVAVPASRRRTKTTPNNTQGATKRQPLSGKTTAAQSKRTPATKAKVKSNKSAAKSRKGKGVSSEEDSPLSTPESTDEEIEDHDEGHDSSARRSKFFDETPSKKAQAEGLDVSNDEDASDDEEEVITPRATTARTRGRAARN